MQVGVRGGLNEVAPVSPLANAWHTVGLQDARGPDAANQEPMRRAFQTLTSCCGENVAGKCCFTSSWLMLIYYLDDGGGYQWDENMKAT